MDDCYLCVIDLYGNITEKNENCLSILILLLPFRPVPHSEELLVPVFSVSPQTTSLTIDEDSSPEHDTGD